ncbi:hypothetical protein NM22_06980 [Vibrio tubiashii]|nr:hypothetical protein NM22_06980 [Vibrio tubiashii]
MRRFAKAGILLVALSSPLAVACEPISLEDSLSSLMSNSTDISCTAGFDLEESNVFDESTALALSTDEKSEQNSYWSHWLNGEEGNPIVSNSAQFNHFGVGVWVPEDLEDQLRDMDTKHWIRSHGLQLSLGFGDKESAMPRMRFDYRWHQQYDGDFLVQLEVPF